MNSKLRIPSPLRSFTNGQAILEVQGSNIKEILDELFEKYPELRGQSLTFDMFVLGRTGWAYKDPNIAKYTTPSKDMQGKLDEIQ